MKNPLHISRIRSYIPHGTNMKDYVASTRLAGAPYSTAVRWDFDGKAKSMWDTKTVGAWGTTQWGGSALGFSQADRVSFFAWDGTRSRLCQNLMGWWLI